MYTTINQKEVIPISYSMLQAKLRLSQLHITDAGIQYFYHIFRVSKTRTVVTVITRDSTYVSLPIDAALDYPQEYLEEMILEAITEANPEESKNLK